jgi:hypothetical protein
MGKRGLLTLILMIVFILVFSISSLAIDLSIEKNDFLVGENVIISIGSCSEISVVEIKNPQNQLVNVVQGFSSWQLNYNTNSDSLSGLYKIKAICGDGSSIDVDFCFDDDECEVNVLVDSSDLVNESDGTDNLSNSSNHSNVSLNISNVSNQINVTSNTTCVANWVCGVWSACNVGYQNKGCIDRNRCFNETREDRECVDDSGDGVVSDDESGSFGDDGLNDDDNVDDGFSDEFDEGFESYEFDESEQGQVVDSYSNFDGSDDLVVGAEGDFIDDRDDPTIVSAKDDDNLVLFLFGFIVLFILVAGLVAYFVLFSKKIPANLFSYVKEQKRKGIGARDVLNKILTSGWDKRIAKKVIKKVFKK